MAPSLNLFMMIRPENHEGQSSINGANYMSHFQKDRPIYNDSPGCMTGQQKTLGLGSWEEILEQCTMGFHTEPAYTGVALEQQNTTLSGLLVCDSTAEKEFDSFLPNNSTWQVIKIFSFVCLVSLHSFPSRGFNINCDF